MGEFIENYKGLLLFMFVYWGICFAMLLADGSFLYVMLSWNVLLAVLPLLFIIKAEITIKQRKLGVSVIWLLLWLLFFPNSVYVITDFIHISNDKFLWMLDVGRYSSESSVAYSNEIIVWAKLFVIGFGFFFAIVAGLESFYIFERNVRKKYSAAISFCALTVVAVLTGLGVYIGRFLRFNSWDLFFNPIALIKEIIGADIFALQFICVFTVFVAGSYLLYRTIRKQSGHREYA